jgi:uncharacterized protein (DUF3820 family)
MSDFIFSENPSGDSPSGVSSHGEPFDTGLLVELANARMPFGKYKGRLLLDLPEAYVVWFAREGWPAGRLGELLASLYAIKENGLEGLLRPLVEAPSGSFSQGRAHL